MAHANWCEKRCADCEGCWLDESFPCSPDCELLGENGYPKNYMECKRSGCDAIEEIEIMGIEEE